MRKKGEKGSWRARRAVGFMYVDCWRLSLSPSPVQTYAARRQPGDRLVVPRLSTRPPSIHPQSTAALGQPEEVSSGCRSMTGTRSDTRGRGVRIEPQGPHGGGHRLQGCNLQGLIAAEDPRLPCHDCMTGLALGRIRQHGRAAETRIDGRSPANETGVRPG